GGPVHRPAHGQGTVQRAGVLRVRQPTVVFLPLSVSERGLGGEVFAPRPRDLSPLAPLSEAERGEPTKHPRLPPDPVVPAPSAHTNHSTTSFATRPHEPGSLPTLRQW